MAKYKEIWESPNNDTIIGYMDTENGGGFGLSPGNKDYQAFLEWQTDGGVADPAYTAEEIAAFQAAETAAAARAYVLETDNHILSYTERKAAKLAGRVNTLKYKSLRRKRAVALGRI
jgi:hypothetical protein